MILSGPQSEGDWCSPRLPLISSFYSVASQRCHLSMKKTCSRLHCRSGLKSHNISFCSFRLSLSSSSNHTTCSNRIYWHKRPWLFSHHDCPWISRSTSADPREFKALHLFTVTCCIEDKNCTNGIFEIAGDQATISFLPCCVPKL